MEIIRWIQSGQSLASIIEFEAIDYVFGKKKIKEYPWNARNCLEMCRILWSMQVSVSTFKQHFALRTDFQKQWRVKVKLPNAGTRMRIKQRRACNFKHPRAKSLSRLMKTTSQKQKIQPHDITVTDIYIRNKTASKNGGNRSKEFPKQSQPKGHQMGKKGRTNIPQT